MLHFLPKLLMLTRKMRSLDLVSLLLLSHAPVVLSHGLMAIPNQRGTLNHYRNNMNAPVIDPDAVIDFYSHFPAGDKCEKLGCGRASQKRAAGSAGWNPFTPLNPSFVWRAGVCGDPLNNPEHTRGGRYYNNGQIVATYTQDTNISITLNFLAHHNGFVEFHICDVAKCNGEISQKCFREGHCEQLKRSKNPKCDSGFSKECAPVDPEYPGRWYLPCSKYGKNNGFETFGKGTIVYDLPQNLHCKHCVLQWFYITANFCNPPGIIDFFDGPNAPKNWGKCPGQAGALGGVSRVQKPCGKGDDGQTKFPEEYMQCADIAIKPKEDNNETGQPAIEDSQQSDELICKADTNTVPTSCPRPSRTPKPEPITSPKPVAADELMHSNTPEYNVKPPTVASVKGSPEAALRPSALPSVLVPCMNSRSGLISGLLLYLDGKKIQCINDGDKINVSGSQGISFEAVTTREVPKVEFYINGKLVKTEHKRPYFLSGNRKRKEIYSWENPILNEKFTVVTKAEGSAYEATIELTDMH